MTAPVIRLPRQFEGSTLSKVIDRLVAESPRGLPEHVIFDFCDLAFIKPAGVVFLSNLVHWLNAHGAEVTFTSLDRKSAALSFLDDSLFFEQHCGSKIRETSSPRATTRPLIKIAQSQSHAWLDRTFIPWLAGRLGVTKASLYPLQNCISELFNNIQDHTQFDIGSIFVQCFPVTDRINIALSDFGAGIPEVVRRVKPDLPDAEAIIQAVEEGFTTKSLATNKGVGLDYLLKTVVRHNGGQVTIYSLGGIVQFVRQGTGVRPIVLSQGGFCPGTTVDIELRSDTIENVPDESEDLQW